MKNQKKAWSWCKMPQPWPPPTSEAVMTTAIVIVHPSPSRSGAFSRLDWKGGRRCWLGPLRLICRGSILTWSEQTIQIVCMKVKEGTTDIDSQEMKVLAQMLSTSALGQTSKWMRMTRIGPRQWGQRARARLDHSGLRINLKRKLWRLKCDLN